MSINRTKILKKENTKYLTTCHKFETDLVEPTQGMSSEVDQNCTKIYHAIINNMDDMTSYEMNCMKLYLNKKVKPDKYSLFTA